MYWIAKVSDKNGNELGRRQVAGWVLKGVFTKKRLNPNQMITFEVN